MASKTIIICDRCKKEISYIGKTTVIKGLRKKVRKFRFRYLLDGNHSGYSYLDQNFELCSDCTRAFEKFLKNQEDNRNETD